MLTSKDPRDSLFQEGSSRFLFGRGPSACPLVFPLCLVFPPVDRHSRLDLSHYYTRFSYYTRHPFYSEANVEKRSLRAATLGSRFTPACRSLPFALVRLRFPLSLSLSPCVRDPPHQRIRRFSPDCCAPRYQRYERYTIIITTLREAGSQRVFEMKS